jgi:hypothetical protein
MKRNLLIVLIIASFSSLSLSAQEKKVEYIINKAFDAVGGRMLWENTKTYVAMIDAKSASNIHNPSNLFNQYKYSSMIRLFKKSNEVYLDRFIKVDKTNVEDSFSTCINGEKFWSQMGHSEPYVYLEDASERHSKFVNYGYPSTLLKADSILYSDSLSSAEENYEVLEVYIDGTISFFFINNQNYLLEKSYASTSIEAIAYYRDFREIQGRKVPYLQETLINGVLGGSYHYTIVRFDIDLDDIYFKFPEHPPYNILAKPLDIEFD